VRRDPEWRHQNPGIPKRDVGGENIWIRGGRTLEALTVGQMEPVSGQESPRSEGFPVGDSSIMRGQARRFLPQVTSESKSGDLIQAGPMGRRGLCPNGIMTVGGK